MEPNNNLSNKYIIYKGTGGFVHMISGLIYCIEKSLLMNRILLIDLECNPAFERKFSNYFEITENKLEYTEDYNVIPKEFFNDSNPDYFNHIQKSIKSVNDNYIINNNIKVETEIDILNDANIIINAGPKAFNKVKDYYFKVKDSYLEKIQNENTLPKNQYISIHFRNTDKKNDINIFLKKIKKVINEKKINIIYLATDDYNFYDNFRNNFDCNIEIIQYTKPIQLNENQKNIHYCTKDKDKLNYNTLVDMYMILNSTYFVPSINSGYSKFLCLMIQNKKNIFNIISNTIIEKV